MKAVASKVTPSHRESLARFLCREFARQNPTPQARPTAHPAAGLPLSKRRTA